MLACHAGDPGSIPGRCNYVLIMHNHYHLPGEQLQCNRSLTWRRMILTATVGLEHWLLFPMWGRVIPPYYVSLAVHAH